jgi:hypothetical protein
MKTIYFKMQFLLISNGFGFLSVCMREGLIPHNQWQEVFDNGSDVDTERCDICV